MSSNGWGTQWGAVSGNGRHSTADACPAADHLPSQLLGTLCHLNLGLQHHSQCGAGSHRQVAPSAATGRHCADSCPHCTADAGSSRHSGLHGITPQCRRWQQHRAFTIDCACRHSPALGLGSHEAWCCLHWQCCGASQPSCRLRLAPLWTGMLSSRMQATHSAAPAWPHTSAAGAARSAPAAASPSNPRQALRPLRPCSPTYFLIWLAGAVKLQLPCSTATMVVVHGSHSPCWPCARGCWRCTSNLPHMQVSCSTGMYSQNLNVAACGQPSHRVTWAAQSSLHAAIGCLWSAAMHASSSQRRASGAVSAEEARARQVVAPCMNTCSTRTDCQDCAVWCQWVAPSRHGPLAAEHRDWAPASSFMGPAARQLRVISCLVQPAGCQHLAAAAHTEHGRPHAQWAQCCPMWSTSAPRCCGCGACSAPRPLYRC